MPRATKARSLVWFFWSAGLLALAPRVARAESLNERQSADLSDLLAVERQHPMALEGFKKAEQLLAAGKAAEAAELLQQARVEAPNSVVLARRHCQAFMQLGHRSSALNACDDAMEKGRSPMTARAAVAALMMAAPTPDELAYALKLRERAKLDLSTQPYGYAAECDIARRLGDRAMYKDCLENLQAMAPGHYETVRAEELGAFAVTPRWVPLAWIALGLGVLASVVHALQRSFRLRRVAQAAYIALALSAAAPASAQEVAAAAAPVLDQAPVERALDKPGGLSKWKINDAEPLKSLPSATERDQDPLHYGYFLMDLADKAQEAEAKGDFAAAAKYWEVTVVAVPDVAMGYRKTCAAAEKAKNLARAFRYCRAALGREGVQLGDYEHYFALLQQSPEQLAPEQLTDLLEISKHVRTLPQGERLAEAIECEYGLRASDWGKLETCSKKLAAAAPDDPKTITYQWALALGRERFDDARALIDHARKTTMKPEGIRAMEAATAQRSGLGARLRGHSKAIVGVLIGVGVLGLIYALSRYTARRRGKSVDIAPAATV